MSIAGARDTGRAEGVWIMVHDVPAHLACGWRIVDDCHDGGPRGFMLLAPPPAFASVLVEAAMGLPA